MQTFGELIKEASITNTENDIKYIHGLIQEYEMDITEVLEDLYEYGTIDFSEKLIANIALYDFHYDRKPFYQTVFEDNIKNEIDVFFACNDEKIKTEYADLAFQYGYFNNEWEIKEAIIKHLDSLDLKSLENYHDTITENYGYFVDFERENNKLEKSNICSYLLSSNKSHQIISDLFDYNYEELQNYNNYNFDKITFKHFVDNIEKYENIVIDNHENIIDFLIAKQEQHGEQPEDNIILRSLKSNSEYITIEKPDHKAFLEEKIYKMELMNF